MLSAAFQTARDVFAAGGVVMWPLLLLSVVSVAISLERAMFWIGMSRGSRRAWLARLADRLRHGDEPGARAVIGRDDSIYSRIALGLIERGASEAATIELTEANRRPIERFSATLSTIITAAPLLGILGTVTGIIESFRLIGGGSAAAGGAASPGSSVISDPTAVAGGIAEALITTAAGLTVAMLTLFPYAWLRVAADRCLGRIEALSAAAIQGASHRAAERPSPARGENAPRPLAAAGASAH